MKLRVGCVGVWAVVALLGVGVVNPPGTEAAAAPVPCCRRGGFGLGFVGGFLIGRHRGRWHGGGGCGGGCGWCGGCGYGRKRRSLDEVLKTDKLEEIYFKIASEDKEGCGLRLVCELASKEPDYLSSDEVTILLPYRGRDESDEKTYYGQYDKAVWHGQKGNTCHKLYSLCPLSVASIMANAALNTTIPY